MLLCAFFRNRIFFGIGGEPPSKPVTRDYLHGATLHIAAQSFYSAIVEHATGGVIDDICLP